LTFGFDKLPLASASGQSSSKTPGLSPKFRLKPKGNFFTEFWLKPLVYCQTYPPAKAGGNLQGKMSTEPNEHF
jgi:hypothetical protein